MKGTSRLAVVAWFGLVGGSLGVLAGTAQATIGPRISAWSGAKAEPTLLGLLTVLLSAIAIASSWFIRPAQAPSHARRFAALAGLLVPAAVCFTTVGRLWYVPGVLLFTAAFQLVKIDGLRRVVHTAWRRRDALLLTGLGGFEMLMAATAAPLGTAVIGVGGGLLLAVSTWLHTGPKVGWSLIALATVPFALLTWWSLATPLVAATALLIAAHRQWSSHGEHSTVAREPLAVLQARTPAIKQVELDPALRP